MLQPLRAQPALDGGAVVEDAALEFETDRADNVHRLNMGVFPKGARIIPNPYNKIPGFSCAAAGLAGSGRGQVFFVPGFPVMAWPMIEWVLDEHFAPFFHRGNWIEKSVIVYGAMEASLTPFMEALELRFEGVRIFSLPSVDHPEHGKHIELGVKGEGEQTDAAYSALMHELHQLHAQLGPVMVRS